MSEQIVYIDRSEILDGKLEELEEGINELVEFVDAREPQLISYGFFINEEAARMTVIAVHPDSASLEYHMEIADAEFRKLAGFIKLVTIEVYGRPSNRALKQLRQKAQMLGEGESVVVQEQQAGFARFPPHRPVENSLAYVARCGGGGEGDRDPRHRNADGVLYRSILEQMKRPT